MNVAYSLWEDFLAFKQNMKITVTSFYLWLLSNKTKKNIADCIAYKQEVTSWQAGR